MGRNITLPRDLLAWLEAEAERRGATVSGLLRELAQRERTATTQGGEGG